MSSYLTSPFILEERRLQGIVDQCSRDFYCALIEVEEQEKRIKRRKKEQEERARDYDAAKKAAVFSGREQQKRLLEESRRKKTALEERLKNTEIEIEVFSEKYGGMEAAIERQKRLALQLHNTLEDFEEIERHVIRHEAEIQREIRTVSEEEAGARHIYPEGRAGSRGKKGVSLQIKKEREAERAKDSPRRIFEDRLNRMMGSPYAGRLPSLGALKEQYDKERDYAKTAFAVTHMKQLEAMTRQLEGLMKLEQRGLEKRNKDILRYRAICRLMEIPADEKLIADEKAERLLEHTCDELYRKYEEKQRERYITDSITCVMEKYGILYQNSDASQGDERMHFEMEQGFLDVSGMDGDRLIMEVSGEYAGEEPTLNERRKGVSAAGHFCALLADIEAELRDDYGIVFCQVLTEKPREETIGMKRKKSVAAGGGRSSKKEQFI